MRQLIHIALLSTSAAFLAAVAVGQASADGVVATYTATTANVSGAPDAVRMEIIRWSTDAERDELWDAWTNPEPPEAAAGGRGGRGGGRGGRGGRGGAPAAPAAPPTPEESLAAALQKAPTVGYLWTSEAAGYAVRLARQVAQPDGGSRILLLTDRRLGGWNSLWTPKTGMPNKYEFSVIEMRVNAKGTGEGKASLTGAVTPDQMAKLLTLGDYASLPVVLKDVKRQED